MLKLYSGYEFPSDMDLQCVHLCDAICALPGVTTVESCCGHGKESFQVFIEVDTAVHPAAGLFFLTRCVDRRYWEYGHLWNFELHVADLSLSGRLPIVYYLHSGNVVGEEAYKQAESLLENMNYHLNHVNFCRGFNLDVRQFKTLEYEAQP